MERGKNSRPVFAQRRGGPHTEVRVTVWLGAVIFLSVFIMACGRISHQPQGDLPDYSLINPTSQKNIRTVVHSVVGISAVVDYRLEFFQYELAGGKFIPEPGAPTGYRLARGTNAVKTARKTQKISGGGLILYQNPSETLILTCEHVINSPDTVRTFLRDPEGRDTKIPSSRAIKRLATYHVINQINQLLPAEILSFDTRVDLGLVLVKTAPLVGEPYSFSIAYENEVQWSDLAFVFGYPREIKQLTMGLISPSPYPGTFAMDVVARYGFSGGPVFAIRPGGDLQLAGIVRGVPVTKLRYITPPPELPAGQNLATEDLPLSTADEYDLIEYGTVYVVGTERIGKFLKDSQSRLQQKGMYLPASLLPK
jgi:hypothetical protein